MYDRVLAKVKTPGGETKDFPYIFNLVVDALTESIREKSVFGLNSEYEE